MEENGAIAHNYQETTSPRTSVIRLEHTTISGMSMGGEEGKVINEVELFAKPETIVGTLLRHYDPNH